MEHIVSRWEEPNDLVLDLIKDESSVRSYIDEVMSYYRENPRLDDRGEPLQSDTFRIVEVETGREITFPIQLIANTSFGERADGTGA